MDVCFPQKSQSFLENHSHSHGRCHIVQKGDFKPEKIGQFCLKVAGIFFAILFLSAAFSVGSLPAKTYYVDITNPAASNKNPGTEALPWATIHKANRVVGPGDTVIVKPEIYHDWIYPDKNGTASQWIVYRSVPEHEAILDGWVLLDSVAADTASWASYLAGHRKHLVPPAHLSRLYGGLDG